MGKLGYYHRILIDQHHERRHKDRLRSNRPLTLHWGAIDIFRQLNRANLSFGPLVAAMVITYWGLFFNTFQFYSHHSSNSAIAMLFGSFLPGIALLSVTVRGYQYPSNFRTDLFSNTPLTQGESSALLLTVNALMIATFVVTGIWVALGLLGQYEEATREDNTVFANLLVLPFLVIIFADLMGYFSYRLPYSSHARRYQIVIFLSHVRRRAYRSGIKHLHSCALL